MKGRLYPPDLPGAGGRAALTLTVRVSDVERFVTEPDHLATVEGQVHCDWLGGRLDVVDGRFNILVSADGDPARKRMIYNLDLSGDADRRLTLHAVKEIVDDPGVDVWRDTTRAAVTVYAGWVGTDMPGEPIALGTVRIHLLDFLHQLTTFRAHGGTIDQRAAALVRFGRHFLGNLWDVYGRDVLTYSPF